MKSFAIILIVVVLAVGLYFKRAANSFRLLLQKIDRLSLKNKQLNGIVTLQIINEKLPNFDIKDIDLQLFVNNEFVAPITSYTNLTNGYLQLNINVDLAKLLSIEKLLLLLVNNNYLQIKGSINVSKGFINKTITVNEQILI